MTSLVVHDPGAIVAVAKCWLSRWTGDTFGLALRPSHPDRCGWCDYPAPVLMDAIEDFWRYDGGAMHGRISADFDRLAPGVQARLVREAQEA